MTKEYIPLFLDFNETTQDLTDEECGRLVRAIIDYANDCDCEDRLTGAEKIAFRFLKGLVDRNKAISKKRAIAASNKNKDEQNEANDSKQEQNETNENKTEQNEANLTTKNQNQNRNQNKNQNKEQKQKQTNFAFDQFWSAYPRHENKQGAMKAFEKAKVDDALLEIILTAIERQKSSPQWQENGGQFIPHPATWLNGKRWEDEVSTVKAATVNAQAYTQRDYLGEQEAAFNRMILEIKGEGA